MPATFISYRREDSAGYAGRLHQELEERFGPGQVFRDVDTLRAGQDFDEAIRRRLEQCQACVVMIGPGWLKAQTASGHPRLHQPGDYVCMEIAAALSRPDVLVIPVLVGGATMPDQESLPESIRALARRHAMTVRDETWEADMDRLAAALRQASRATPSVPPPRPATRPGVPRYLVPMAVAAVIVAVGLAFVLKDTGGAVDKGRSPDGTASDGRVPTSVDAVPPPNATSNGAASAFDVPSAGSEVAIGELIYTPLTGSVQRRGNGMRVWLRVRVSNESFYSRNLWDKSFRLVAGGHVVQASGDLNEILDRRTITQVVVRFDVPEPTAKVTLRIGDQDDSGDIPLDVSGNGSPPRHEEPDPRDALSHAVLRSVLRDETPLITDDALSATILRSSVRRFVNKQRVILVMKWTNGSRYSVSSGELVLRLAASGEVLAPVQQPVEVVAAGATHVGDVVFEVRPDVRSVTVKASIKETSAERTLTLP